MDVTDHSKMHLEKDQCSLILGENGFCMIVGNPTTPQANLLNTILHRLKNDRVFYNSIVEYGLRHGLFELENLAPKKILT
jgi:hypothetical protein